MSEQQKGGNPENEQIDVGHPSGLSPSDRGESGEELEGSAKAFENKRSFVPGHAPRELRGEEPPLGPGGDSRSDPPGEAGFVDASDHPVFDSNREPEKQPRVEKEDEGRLAESRHDALDNVRAEPGPLGEERAVLKPDQTKEGQGTSEGL